MRIFLSVVFLASILPGAIAQESQDRSDEILRKIDGLLKERTERVRAELVELIRAELAGPPAAGKADRARALVTEELLRGHAATLAADELEGRNAGYPGNDKAAAYIEGVFKKAGLKPAGAGGTYFQKFRVGSRETQNCVALLEGSDPELKKEYLVIGAHYDHVGTADQVDKGRLGGARGDDRIWNGADDNASGTSSMLAVARAFAEGGLASRRSIVFIAFSGEEAGLIGSKYYTNHPVAPIGQHVYMLNLDMVGRNPDRPMDVQGVGSGEGGSVRKAVERAVEKSGLRAKITDRVTLLGGDSDHTSFSDKGVPFTFFFSGFHADYHRATDHADKLAYANMVKVAHTAIEILLEIGNADERPRFFAQAGGLKLPDFGRATPPSGRVLGITVEDLDDDACNALKLGKDQGGVLVGAVQAGGVADVAGVKEGDTILSVAGEALPRTAPRAGLRSLLGTKVQPGRDIPVLLLRDGKKITVLAKWKE